MVRDSGEPRAPKTVRDLINELCIDASAHVSGVFGTPIITNYEEKFLDYVKKDPRLLPFYSMVVMTYATSKGIMAAQIDFDAIVED